MWVISVRTARPAVMTQLQIHRTPTTVLYLQQKTTARAQECC
eukprot:COSAG03_NODE_805_length_5785_cov_2.177278_2_plen_42_part_00